MENTIKFKRLSNGDDLPLPQYQSEGAAGMDVCSAIDVTLAPGGGVMIPTGWSVEVPAGYEIQVRSRSGLAKQGIFVTNSPGTVDSDYRGEICVLLSNLDIARSFKVKRGDRIAQLVLNEVPRFAVKEVQELSDTTRGEGGFGSTGK